MAQTGVGGKKMNQDREKGPSQAFMLLIYTVLYLIGAFIAFRYCSRTPEAPPPLVSPSGQKQKIQDIPMPESRDKGAPYSRQASGKPGKISGLERKIYKLERKWARQKGELAALLKNMRIVDDPEEGITRYYNKHVSHFRYKNSIEAYIGQNRDGEIWLRLRIYYNGEKKLNIETYELVVEKQRFLLDARQGSLESGRGIAGAWEWLDARVSSKELKLIKAVMVAQRATIHYKGKSGNFKRVITEGEKQRLQQVLHTFKALSSASTQLSLYRYKDRAALLRV